MKALVYYGPEDLRYEEVTDSAPGKNEVRVRVTATGICGSDVHGYAGLTGRRIAPMIMGHEFCGEVESLGDGVEKLKSGDRVIPFPIIACGQCDACNQGFENKCRDKEFFGVLTKNGSMAEALCVHEDQVIKIDERIDDISASMAEPLAVALHGIRRAPDLKNKTVFVAGAGTIGLFVVSLLQQFECAKIIVSDLNAHRLSVAKKLGADAVIKADEQDVKSAVFELTGQKGADVSLECAGITPTVRQALHALKIGGHAVWIGNSARQIETDMQDIVTNEWNISGSFLYTRQDFIDVIQMLASGSIDISPVISQTIGLEDGPAMFSRLYKSPGDLVKVVITSEAPPKSR